MKARPYPFPYTLLTVRMPPDLQSVLETVAAAKGESVSTIVRDLVRAVAADARRGDQTEIMAGRSDIVADFIESGRRGSTAGSPVSAKDFK
jgi:hypothetical protein